MAWHEGDLIHKLRRVCGWTVEKLAKEANLNPSIIRRLETGRTKEPERKTVAAIAHAFHLTPREFTDAIPTGAVPTPRLEGQAPSKAEQLRRRA